MESNKRTDIQPFQRTPLHLCQLVPTSLELSCQTGVGKLKVSTSVFAYIFAIFAMLKSSVAATENKVRC